MQSVIDKALEDSRRQRFLEEANRQFAALRADLQAWQEELEDVKLGTRFSWMACVRMKSRHK